MEEKDQDLMGGELTDIPNDKYKKFFARFEEIKTLSVNEWKPVHLLSFFCQKYQEKYNLPYQFKYNTPAPGKSFEVFHIKKLSIHLSSDPNILRDYISWIFNNKVPQLKRRFTSISFVTDEKSIIEYKRILLNNDPKNHLLNRSTPLPTNLIEVLEKYGVNAKTYGDLAFSAQAMDFSEIYKRLEEKGIDIASIKKII